ncbi:MAG TPA: C-GCAxxG-C-C family protein [Anaeromyxobacteraceae bacterium]|nr:C-GCAxxG-C-C family protein [Anaeromyxobacteraceae bacterium]
MANERENLGRREILTRAGLVLGGAVAAGALQACGSEDSPPVDPGPQVSEFPYAQHIAAGYQLDVAAVKEAAYQNYWAGGCCHGAFSSLVGHLAQTVGQPFSLLPVDFGKFGGGGVAGYGSICGAVLGSTLVLNMVVADPPAPAPALRNPMIAELMRWYEGHAFPGYTPTTVNSAEAGQTTLDFSEANLVNLQRAPHSHLCHASVSDWCAANAVSASGKDKQARCARLTADVAGKAAAMLNDFLANVAFVATGRDAVSANCVGCHTSGSPLRPVASGMECGSCHSDKLVGHY